MHPSINHHQKKKEPPKNHRPINLLLNPLKKLSKRALKRSEDAIVKYMSLSQSTYRKGLSITDIVLSYT